MSRLRAVVVIGIALGLWVGVAQAAAPSRDEAVAVAKGWLALVDAGRYAESWGQSAGMFRKAVTQEQWNQALTASRGPLGALKTRNLGSAQEATSLPGAPDGKYVVMQFQTVFANKASAVETVTTVLEADGRWRIAGYFIK